jgi:hypothetical protein
MTTQGAKVFADCYAGQDGAVSNAKVFHTINLKVAIYYRHGVAPHLGTACLVQTGLRRLTNEIFQLLRLQIAWQNLALNKGAKWHRVAYFPAKLYTCHCSLEIVGMGQRIRFDQDRIIRIGARQTDLASAFRPRHDRKQRPAIPKRVELGTSLRVKKPVLQSGEVANPVCRALGKAPNPPTANIFVPTPNHDHVVDNSRVIALPIWWEVRPVLILNQSDWPSADGSSGITSSHAMDDAEAAGRAIEVGSNFFLFFSSEMSSSTMASHDMHAMPANTERPSKPTAAGLPTETQARGHK